jgi:hypothetical protein
VFVLGCVLRALRDIGAQLEVRDSSDRPSSALQFRLAPGLIYNPTTAPGFVLVSFQGSRYELQNSLRVRGRSDVRHELDVCILHRSGAEDCRRHQVDPKQADVVFLAECKCYGASLPLHLGREYLGLSAEFTLRIKTIVSNQTSQEIHALVTAHKGTGNFGVTPLDPAVTDRFANWLANEFLQVLR